MDHSLYLLNLFILKKENLCKILGLLWISSWIWIGCDLPPSKQFSLPDQNTLSLNTQTGGTNESEPIGSDLGNSDDEMNESGTTAEEGGITEEGGAEVGANEGGVVEGGVVEGGITEGGIAEGGIAEGGSIQEGGEIAGTQTLAGNDSNGATDTSSEPWQGYGLPNFNQTCLLEVGQRSYIVWTEGTLLWSQEVDQFGSKVGQTQQIDEVEEGIGI